jgi:hypothetical protein
MTHIRKKNTRHKNVYFKRKHSCRATNVCLNPIVAREYPGSRTKPGRRFSNINQGTAQALWVHQWIRCTIAYNNRRGNEHHTPPENARSTLKAFVLFSTLLSDFTTLRMPIMIARIKTSPTELMVNEILEMQLRAKDSNENNRPSCTEG